MFPKTRRHFHVIIKKIIFKIPNHRATVSPQTMYVYNSVLGARLSAEYGSLSSESRHQSDLNAVGTISIIMITTMLHLQRLDLSFFFRLDLLTLLRLHFSFTLGSVRRLSTHIHPTVLVVVYNGAESRAPQAESGNLVPPPESSTPFGKMGN